MESRTYFKNLQITPRKLRVAADMVRKDDPYTAVQKLQNTNKKSAQILLKVMKSALANAKQTLKLSEDMIQLRLLTIEEGQKLRRYRPSSRGMVRPFARQFAHAKIVLVAKELPKHSRKKAKTEVEEKPETAKKKVTKSDETQSKKDTKSPSKKKATIAVTADTAESKISKQK